MDPIERVREAFAEKDRLLANAEAKFLELSSEKNRVAGLLENAQEQIAAFDDRLNAAVTKAITPLQDIIATERKAAAALAEKMQAAEQAAEALTSKQRAEIAELQGTVDKLADQVTNMEGHPDVIAAREAAAKTAAEAKRQADMKALEQHRAEVERLTKELEGSSAV